jgi:hypothetical protein
VTVANSAPAAPALNIYTDALQSPWINNSWSATVAFNSTAQKYDGTSAISVTQNAWGALSLHSGNWSGSTGITPALYQSLDFVVYGGPSGASISAMVENDAGASFPQIKCGFVAANTWTVISVPVSQLDPGNLVFHRIDIMEISGVTRTYSVDNIRLVDKSPAGGAQPVSSPGESAADLPKTIELAQNFPNPFNPTTVISYTLSADAHVMIEIYNGIGQRVATLVDEELPAGRHDARFEGSNLASGVYFYRLTASVAGTAAPYIETKRMILAK